MPASYRRIPRYTQPTAVSRAVQLFKYLFENFGAHQFYLPLTRASRFQSLADSCRSRFSLVWLEAVAPHLLLISVVLRCDEHLEEVLHERVTATMASHERLGRPSHYVEYNELRVPVEKRFSVKKFCKIFDILFCVGIFFGELKGQQTRET